MLEDCSKLALLDIIRLFCTEQLGDPGIGRTTFVFGPDPTKVVKIEIAAGSFQNALEWQTWTALKATRYAKFLAPCVSISDCGVALIQERVVPLPTELEEKLLPARARVLKDVRFPEFLTDTKRENYGLYKGRIVACDYGSNLAINHGAFASHMRKVKWW